MNKAYRSDITDIARAYIGVPWKHQGHDRNGVDCIGLAIAVWCELRFTPTPKVPAYRAHPDGTMLQYIEPYLDRIPTNRIKAGSVVVYAFQKSPYHVGIVLDPDRGSIVHSVATQRKVVVDMLHHGKTTRRLLCAWDYPGVKDG